MESVIIWQGLENVWGVFTKGLRRILFILDEDSKGTGNHPLIFDIIILA